jgi:O-antigen ligase
MGSSKRVTANEGWEVAFSAAAGLWLGLALIKLGHPIILDHEIRTPANRDEFLLSPWPLAWGLSLFTVVLLGGLRFVHRPSTKSSLWLVILPLVWLVWQTLAAVQTVDRSLTSVTLKHFAVCVAAFYVGFFAFSRVSRLHLFWLGLIGSFAVILLVGWRQHFGGLEETRRYFYSLPNWRSFPPEFLQKLSSDRISSTLFYPNALAGAVILLLPVCLANFWKRDQGWTIQSRVAATGIMSVLGLGCLYWSGSKAGWLIVLGQAVAALARVKLSMRTKAVIAACVLLAGVAGFWLKYQAYIDRGATSVSARFEYWRAGWQTLTANPMLGTGPGTFMVSYKSLKRPEAEMTRLAHNDFLQQGSDSGWVGLLTFGTWFVGCIVVLYRRSRCDNSLFGIWLGLCGIFVQSFVEFPLYIPALSWLTFFLTGWLLGGTGSRNRIDKTNPVF